MGRIVRFLSIVALATVMFGSTALAGNDANNNRVGNVRIPCQGLYTAGVGNPPGSGGATVGTPGFARVTENDLEMCHGGIDPPGE